MQLEIDACCHMINCIYNFLNSALPEVFGSEPNNALTLRVSESHQEFGLTDFPFLIQLFETFDNKTSEKTANKIKKASRKQSESKVNNHDLSNLEKCFKSMHNM